MQDHTRPRRFSRLFAAALVCLPLFAARAAMPEFDENDLDKLDPIEREAVRQRMVREWSHRPGIKQNDYIRRLYSPLVEANRADYKRFAQLARKYAERARNAREHRRPEAAEKYAAVAQLCGRRAELSTRIVKSLRDGEMKGFRDVVEKVPEVEQRLTEITGRNIERAWFTPKEVREAYGRWPEIVEKLRDDD